MTYFDWPIAEKSRDYGNFPKREDSMERWSALPFGPAI